MNRLLPLCLTVVLIAAADTLDDFYNAIRSGDLARVQSLAASAGVNAKDQRGTTPLMYAAAFGNAATVKALLDAGAGPNIANEFGATALMWAVNDVEKTRLLLAKGANVNARSNMGKTPLLIAASDDNGFAVVRMLVEHGANVNGDDPPDGSAMSVRSRKMNTRPLIAASFGHSVEMARYLIEKGADVNARSASGETALMSAASEGNVATIKLLLAKGADVNAVSDAETGPGVKNGPIALGSYTPLILAAAYSSPEAVKILLDAGAKVNAQDVRGMTPLMLAIACDHNDVRTVRLLLDRGADPKVKSKAGEDAYDWARKFRVPEIMAALNIKEDVGKNITSAAAPRTGISPAVQKSVALLQKSTAKFLVEGGCAACHAHNITSVAVAAARARGVPADDNAVADQVKATRFGWTAFEQPMLQRTDPPGAPDSTVYAILDFVAAKHPADRTTDAMVFNIAAQQRAAGEWGFGFIARPPIEDGDFSRTALSIRTLQWYGIPARKAEFDQRVARAKAWLLNARPRTTEDRNMKLLGVLWAGTGPAAIQKLAADVLAHQRADGGWSQTPYLDSDAYATGQSLYTLGAAGISPRDPAYQRGIAFLLRTQAADGSWHVASRSPKFQPYFESGFPYGHDQWISAMASAWAVLALAPAVEPAPPLAMR